MADIDAVTRYRITAGELERRIMFALTTEGDEVDYVTLDPGEAAWLMDLLEDAEESILPTSTGPGGSSEHVPGT